LADVFDVGDDSDDEFFCHFILPKLGNEPERSHGGSDPGKRAAKYRERAPSVVSCF
jgi:hypothetical protein